MAIDRVAKDEAQTEFEYHYTGTDILSVLEVGSTIRVPDRCFKNDFEVVEVSTINNAILYSCESSRSGFTISFDPTRRNKIQVGDGTFKVGANDITVVR